MDLLVGVSKENPDAITDKDIREEVDTFLFEGHDTSSIAITMAIIHLGLDQNMQVSKITIKKYFQSIPCHLRNYKALVISKTISVLNNIFVPYTKSLKTTFLHEYIYLFFL